MRSSTRPTVPTTIVPAGVELRLLRADRRAAERRDDVDALALAVGAQRLRDLDAQLAGRREDERLHLVVVGSTYSTIGRPNAAVLPEPVWAWPMRSRPSSIGGIACSWIGLGFS